MSKLGSVADFSGYLTEEFNWRVREISDIRRAGQDQRNGYEIGVRKAALALVYAHWEGYVKFVGEAYLKYVAARKIQYSKLSIEFSAIDVPRLIKKFKTEGMKVGSAIEFLNDLSQFLQGQFKDQSKVKLPVEGNLNYDRLCEICVICGIDQLKVIADGSFLDERVLGVRNRIAHGASVTVTEEELRAASDFVIEGMRSFRNEIEARVVNATYRR
jgi:hypothetical protein